MTSTGRHGSTASRHKSEVSSRPFEDVESEYSKYLPTFDHIQSRYEEVGKALQNVHDTIRITLDLSRCKPLFNEELRRKMDSWIDSVKKQQDSREIYGQVQKIHDGFGATLSKLAELKQDATRAKKARDGSALLKVIEKMKGYEEEYYRVYAKGAHGVAAALPLQ